MKALSLTQPWAALVTIGAKKIETRSWATPYRGRLLIHAAKGLGPVGGKKGLVLHCVRNHFFASLLALLPEHLRNRETASPQGIAERLPLGAIVAMCELIDVRIIGIEANGDPTILADDMLSWTPILGNERAFGNYAAGRYAWLLTNVQALAEPVPCKGALGLWEPDATTVEAVMRQVKV